MIKQIGWNKKYGLDIQTNNIGKGLYIGHAHNINVNSAASIGNNCNLSKGVTIGRENRGSRKGAPTIGNCVWIGTNSVVVGEIAVENDILITFNSFVDLICQIIQKQPIIRTFLSEIRVILRITLAIIVETIEAHSKVDG